MSGGYVFMDAVNDCRVNIGRALNFGGSRWNLESQRECGAGACGLTHDIYGRPVGANSLYYGTNRPCANYSPFPSSRIMAIESSLRPGPRSLCGPPACVADDANLDVPYGMTGVPMQYNAM